MTVPRLALTVNEAAEAIGVSAPTIRKAIRNGHLAKVPNMHRTLIAVAELERFVGAHQTLTSQGAAQ